MSYTYEGSAGDFLELASEQRISIIQKLLVKKSKLSLLAKELDATAPEVFRNLERLEKAGMIMKDVGNYYNLSTCGHIICASLIPSLGFISQNKKYFKDHDFGEIPQKFIQRIGALASGEFVSSYTKVIERWREIFENSNEYVSGIIVEEPLEIIEPLVKKAKNGIKVNSIFSESAIVPKKRNELIQKKGIVSVIFGHPLRYTALPFGNAMEMLIDTQRERVKELEKGQKKLEKIWNQIPDFLVDQDLTRETRLQILQGQTQIFSQINKMYANTKKEFLIFGSEKDFLRFYHADFFELIKNSKHDVKILTSCSEDTMYVFKGFPRTRIKSVQDSATQDLCFIIKDDAQLIFFVRNNPQKSQDLQAILTDSRSLITSMRQLFNLNWSYMKIGTNYEKASLIRKSQSDYDFKLKELEQKRLLMKGIKKYVIKMILKNKKSKKRRKMKRSEY